MAQWHKQSKMAIPDIRRRSEDSILKRFWSHPANWQHTLSVLSVIICLVDVTRHAKVYHQNIQLL